MRQTLQEVQKSRKRKYWTKLPMFIVSIIATLNANRFILPHKYMNLRKQYNDPLALLILNRMTGRYTPDSTICQLCSTAKQR